jgi:DNA-binding LacI/PurR family transcriptional regulator
VTGFDDLFFAEYLEPALTTVRQPMRRMGEMAMVNLLKLMSGEESVAQVKVEAELIVRGSTGKLKTNPGPQMQETRGTHTQGAGRRNG